MSESEDDQNYTMLAENIEALTPAEPIPLAPTTPVIRRNGGKPMKNIVTTP